MDQGERTAEGRRPRPRDRHAGEPQPSDPRPSNSQTRRATVSYYVLPETPCPYLTGQFERKLLTEITGPEAHDLYELLTRAGFRRSHRFAYRPACQDCSACVPVRVPTADFAYRKSVKRIAKLNQDLSAIERPALATQEHYALFKSYLRARHGDGEMAAMGPQEFRAMVEETDLETRIIEFRRPDQALVGALLMDWLSDGASAVYSYFSPAEARRSLGLYMIVWLIDAARRRDLPFVYLGYWIDACQKMAYKTRLQPIEALTDQGWKRMEADGPSR
jgi:arginine-tRNA-protein transferase